MAPHAVCLELHGMQARHFPWIRAALAHLGYRVVGWSARGWSLTFHGEATAWDICRAIEGLWENERPGYPITIRRVYG